MKPVIINSRWELIAPDHIAEWDALTSWERARFADMEAHLVPGMKRWDVGAEHGELSAVYASFVGAENMVLIEPTYEMWANIRLIWEANRLPYPRGCVHALAAEATRRGDVRSIYKGGEWPAADLPEQPARSYAYIHDPGSSIGLAHWRIDDLVPHFGHPDAITIDVEGAEMQVVKGAHLTLLTFHPILWISVHPEMMERDYGVKKTWLFSYLEEVGYAATFLGEDHELHYRFDPR